ncbi:MAG: hypothetical protein Q4B72_14120 [Lachnospiraceae bacterium]|nr:hypothetical protein [Lachnospiraceae bacterium]
MIKQNKTTVTVSNDDWNEILEEFSLIRDSYQHEHLERCYMTHFIRYYNLEKLYEQFKTSPPEDDPDDLPFDSYRN